jgi:hypothetical protein
LHPQEEKKETLMRKLSDLLTGSRQVNADPRIVTALQEYVDTLIGVLNENCQTYRTSFQPDVERITRPADMSVILSSNVSFTLYAVGPVASSYHNALKQINLPTGVTMEQVSYNKRTNTVVCSVNCHKFLHSILLEKLEAQS